MRRRLVAYRLPVTLITRIKARAARTKKSQNALIIALLTQALLSGCAGMQVTWERASREQIAKACPQQKHPVGCAQVKYNQCRILTLDTVLPMSIQEQWLLGHETLHCFKGDYHPQGKATP